MRKGGRRLEKKAHTLYLAIASALTTMRFLLPLKVVIGEKAFEELDES